MSARAFRRPVTTWTGQWNRGTRRFPAGRLSAAVDITLDPVFIDSANAFFLPSISGRETAIPGDNSPWTVIDTAWEPT